MRATRHPSPIAIGMLALALLAPAPLTGAPSGAAAQLTPAAPASPEDGYYVAPDIAVDALGNAVVVWHGEAPGQATPNSEIYARRYGPSGAPLGEPFRVNAAPAGQQRRPAVAVAPDGAFVVAWDTDTRSVWARRFDADGTPLTGDISVAQGSTDRDPDVAVAADGSFVVAWQRTPQGAADDIALARFDLDGTPLGAVLTPHAPADASSQINPALAALQGAAMALVWEEIAADGATAVVLRRLADGAPTGAAQAVAALPAGNQELRDPSIAAAPSGASLVAWSIFSGAGDGVATRSYGADGAPAGAAQVIAPSGPARRSLPAVAVAPDAAYVTWAEAGLTSGSPAGVAARTLAASGEPAGEPFYPRPLAAGAQPALSAAVAMGPGLSDEAWFVWAQIPPGAQTSLSGVYTSRLTKALYTLSLPLIRR